MQVCAKSCSDTANSRKVSTGGIRPTVPNRSQKEDVLTSSKFLRSGLKSGFAFPIMLAAVGLLLASLVLGVGTNLARALGDGNGGICDYSEVMQDAILDNVGLESYQCDDDRFTSTDAAPTSDAWGGPDTDNNGAKELDLSGKSLSTFAPGKGELDAFRPGSRIDLRGNGLTVAEIDLKAATGTFDDATTAYRQFGQSITGVAPTGVTDQEAIRVSLSCSTAVQRPAMVSLPLNSKQLKTVFLGFFLSSVTKGIGLSIGVVTLPRPTELPTLRLQ